MLPSDKREPIQAFSNMTNTMSECSRNDRPMSQCSRNDPPMSTCSQFEASEAAQRLRSQTTSAEGSSSTLVNRSAGTSGVVEDDGTSTEESSSGKSETEGTENETEERTDEKHSEDVESEEEEVITGYVGTTSSPRPTAVYCEETDQFEDRDPSTGAITFWHNTAPLRKNGRLFFPRWSVVAPDAGNPGSWIPEGFEESTSGSTPGPLIAPSVDDSYVRKWAEDALARERVRVVREYDRQWPDLAFARINDLDRALADTATRLIVQATTTESEDKEYGHNSYLQSRVDTTNDYISGVGVKGTEIGNEFADVADKFATIADMLTLVRDLMQGQNRDSIPTQNDLAKLKTELKDECESIRKLLEGLKKKISCFGSSITQHVKDLGTDQPGPREDDEDEVARKRHPVALRVARLLKQDIDSDSANDQSGVFSRWYGQSRLCNVLDGIEKSALKGIKDTEEEDRAKMMKFDLPKFEIHPPKWAVKIQEIDKALVAGTFGESQYTVDEPRSEESDKDDDEMLEFYKEPEYVCNPDLFDAEKLIIAERNKAQQKKEKPETEKAEMVDDFDFYTAAEPKTFFSG